MNSEKTLRRALQINGLFSGVSGLAALFLGQSILAVNEMAAGNGEFFALQLLPFAAFVLYNAYRKGVSRIMVGAIILLDVLYVIGAGLNLVTFVNETSSGGIVLIVVSMLVVSVLAFYQFTGLRKYINHV